MYQIVKKTKKNLGESFNFFNIFKFFKFFNYLGDPHPCLGEALRSCLAQPRSASQVNTEALE